MSNQEISLKPFQQQANLIELSGLSAIQVSGPDATDFLQGQLSCDVQHLHDGQCQFAAYCTHQGRVTATLYSCYWQDAYYLLMPRSIINNTLQHLQKYKLISDIELRDLGEDYTFLAINQEMKLNNIANVTLHLPGNLTCSLLFAETNNMTAIQQQLQQEFHVKDYHYWRLLCIASGLATIFPATEQQFIANRLNLLQTKAIDLNKGCYIGQEIIARLHYRGKLKHHMYQLLIATEQQLIPGEKLHDEQGEVIAEIVDAYQVSANLQQALAVMPDSAIHLSTVFLGQENVQIKLLDLPYSIEEN